MSGHKVLDEYLANVDAVVALRRSSSSKQGSSPTYVPNGSDTERWPPTARGNVPLTQASPSTCSGSPVVPDRVQRSSYGSLTATATAGTDPATAAYGDWDGYTTSANPAASPSWSTLPCRPRGIPVTSTSKERGATRTTSTKRAVRTTAPNSSRSSSTSHRVNKATASKPEWKTLLPRPSVAAGQDEMGGDPEVYYETQGGEGGYPDFGAVRKNSGRRRE